MPLLWVSWMGRNLNLSSHHPYLATAPQWFGKIHLGNQRAFCNIITQTWTTKSTFWRRAQSTKGHSSLMFNLNIYIYSTSQSLSFSPPSHYSSWLFPLIMFSTCLPEVVESCEYKIQKKKKISGKIHHKSGSPTPTSTPTLLAFWLCPQLKHYHENQHTFISGKEKKEVYSGLRIFTTHK